ncbi:protoglobin domain-containing protein [Roseibium alexandrii]|uniref:protoglobin domain-containing protein n=1 Tax=Roseibium alexandrii TaxID=388408 RepID=UPI003751F872
MQDAALEKRLSFHKIDEAAQASLRQNSELILSILPSALDRFYEHVALFGETAAFFRDRAHMMHAKEKQIGHWKIITSGRFDGQYEASVTRIGEIHNQLGLEPRWYIGAYNFLVSEIVAELSRRLPTGPFSSGKRNDLQQLQSAIIRASMLDMDYAIDVYLNAGQRERKSTLERLAVEFETNVGDVINLVTKASHEMSSAAQKLNRTAEDASHRPLLQARCRKKQRQMCKLWQAQRKRWRRQSLKSRAKCLKVQPCQQRLSGMQMEQMRKSAR